MRETQKKKNIVKSLVHTLQKNRIRNFTPKIRMAIEKRNYIIKTAENAEELYQALKLRHEVFIEELLHKRKFAELDVDKFDLKCDHLLIINKEDNAIIGTYRLNSSLHSKKFYSATEFHMRQIVKLPGNKLELGRACVHRNYRNGVTIALLWEGITTYLFKSDTKYMFGCSSVKTMDRKEVSEMIHYFRAHGHIYDSKHIKPKAKFKMPGLYRYYKKRFQPFGESASDQDIRQKVPTLLQSYLKAGAKICANPALDRSFRCVDFLTILDVEKLNEAYNKKSKS